MEVHIGEMQSTVEVTDAQSPLSQKTMEAIVRAVMEALRNEQLHVARVRRERRITGGMADAEEKS